MSQFLYETIAAQINEKILSGEYGEGDRLPTENELAESMNASRPTVRQALDLLAREGTITRIKGSGTYVTQPKLMHESTSFLTGYREESKEKNLTVRTRVLKQDVMRADDRIAQALCLKTGEYVTRLIRVRHLENVYHNLPVVYTTVYVSLRLFPEMPELDFTDASFYSFLEQKHLTVSKASKRLEVTMPPPDVAAELKTGVFEPCVYIESIGKRADGTAVEFSESYYPASRSSFRIELKDGVR